MSLSATFRSTKIPRAIPPKSGKVASCAAAANPSAEAAKRKASASAAAAASGNPSPEASAKKKEASAPGECREKGKNPSPWCVYLIASSRIRRTYVGVTTDFTRRLRQHNGELKGGAKAASAGRPWNLACLIEGFVNRSEACEFESKWKNTSKKMRRKISEPSMSSALQHREKALDRVKTFLDCSHLKIKWH